MLKNFKKLLERGARNNKKDTQMLQTMHDHSVSMGATCASLKESAFSQNDLMTILRNELKEDVGSDCYIIDVFDANLVYSTGYEWSNGGSSSFQIDYSVNDNGDVTWGVPVEVVRKVTYVPTDVSVTENAHDIDITTGEIALVEKAVNNDGTVMLKLISEGLGSSGYYPKDVLMRDGPKVFKQGLFNLIDHPTPQQEKDRPEGSVSNVGSTLQEDARWLDDYNGHGPGLYAKALVKPTFREDLNSIAKDIGMSIRARGKARNGEIDGKQVPIIESIDKALSVDYVTMAGRGGKVVELMESARNARSLDIGVDTMAVDEETFKQLQESNRLLSDQVARLTEATARATALQTVDQVLRTYPTLPATAKGRVRRAFESCDLPFNESGVLDATKLIENAKSAVATETAYLSALGVGSVRGLGANHLPDTQIDDPETQFKKFAESLNDL